MGQHQGGRGDAASSQTPGWGRWGTEQRPPLSAREETKPDNTLTLDAWLPAPPESTVLLREAAPAWGTVTAGLGNQHRPSLHKPPGPSAHLAPHRQA